MNNELKIKKPLMKIAKIGKERYQKEYPKWLEKIGIMNRQQVLQDEINGLKLFVNICFYRGRKDEISYEYASCALQVIEQYKQEIAIQMDEGIVDSIIEAYENKVHQIKTKRSKPYEVNPKDKILLESIFKDLLPKISQINVLMWVIESMNSGASIKQIYKDLKINMVGDKLRGVFLRDIIWWFKLKDKLKTADDYYSLQPIDTWVRQVARRIWRDELEKAKDKEIKRKIVESCLKYDICPLIFSQGIWFIGARSLDCLLDYFILESSQEVL